MNKKIAQYIVANGFTIDKKNDIAYGQINDIFVVFKQDPLAETRHSIQIWAKQENAEHLSEIEDYANQCSSKYLFLQETSYNGSKIIAHFQELDPKLEKEYISCIDCFLKDITAYCRNNHFPASCITCKSEQALSLYQVDNTNYLLCSSCYADLAQKIAQNATQKHQTKDKNIVIAILGALLGSLVGVIMWILLYQVGHISVLGGAVIAICALKGYQLLGGKLNTTCIVISCVISAFMLLIAEQISLSIEIYNAYYREISFFEAFCSTPSLLKDPDIRPIIAFDLVIGYLLMAIGAWGTIHRIHKKKPDRSKFVKITTLPDNQKECSHNHQ